MAIPVKDWTLQQGDTFTKPFWRKNRTIPNDNTSLVNAFDLTDAVIRMQVRSSVSSTKVEVDLSSSAVSGDRLIVDASDCKVTIHITATTMALVKAGSYVYDVECTFPNGDVVKLVKGAIEVEAEVTK